MTTGGGEFGKIRFRNAHVTERATGPRNNHTFIAALGEF
jgi:hypothetical protein